MNKLVIGVGTGRCGTVSLSQLLCHQHNCNVTHERYAHNVRWGSPSYLWAYRLWCDTLGDDDKIVGDVAYYWLPHIEQILSWAKSLGREVRIVGLQRSKNDTVHSYMKWTENHNHWQRHNGKKYLYSKWDHTFPAFPTGVSKRSALQLYWQYYYQRFNQIAEGDPRVKLFPLNTLNERSDVEKLLDFVGIEEDPNIKVAIKANANG